MIGISLRSFLCSCGFSLTIGLYSDFELLCIYLLTWLRSNFVDSCIIFGLSLVFRICFLAHTYLAYDLDFGLGTDSAVQ